MRPRKIILLVDPNQATASLRRFRLDVWGYEVISCPTIEGARRQLAASPAEGDRRVAVVIASLPPSDQSRLTLDHPMHIPFLFLHQDVRGLSPAQVRKRLTKLSVAKRGPHQDLIAHMDAWRAKVMANDQQYLDRAA